MGDVIDLRGTLSKVLKEEPGERVNLTKLVICFIAAGLVICQGVQLMRYQKMEVRMARTQAQVEMMRGAALTSTAGALLPTGAMLSHPQLVVTK